MIATNSFNTTKEVWFVTGSQHLYGPKVLATVAQDSEIIVAGEISNASKTQHSGRTEYFNTKRLNPNL